MDRSKAVLMPRRFMIRLWGMIVSKPWGRQELTLNNSQSISYPADALIPVTEARLVFPHEDDQSCAARELLMRPATESCR